MSENYAADYRNKQNFSYGRAPPNPPSHITRHQKFAGGLLSIPPGQGFLLQTELPQESALFFLPLYFQFSGFCGRKLFKLHIQYSKVKNIPLLQTT